LKILNKNKEMKHLRDITLCMLCIVAVSFSLTSCLDDDDDNNNYETEVLTAAEKTLQMNAMQGFYSSYLYFDNDTTNAIDSVSTTWYINASDSVLSCQEFPVKSLANCVSHSDVKELLKIAPDQHFNAVLHPYYNINKDSGYYTFYMIPEENSLTFTVEKDGTPHVVTLNYATSVTTYNGYGQQILVYSTGAYYNSKISIYLLIKDINIDYTSYTCQSIYMLGGTQ